MTKKAANDLDAEGADRSAADLRRDLSQRERQLRDLTEQALTFLEELAESRRRNDDRDLLAARIGELERVLAETRLRLQHAGGVAGGVVGGPAAAGGSAPDSKPAPIEVVCWGDDAFADAVVSHACAGAVPVSWIGRPSALPAGAPANLRTIVHRDAHSLAQCCNLALLATSADVVLLLGNGHRLAAPPALPALPASMPPNVALLAPRVVGATGAIDELGCVDPDGMLQPQPRASTPDDTDFAAVPFAATAAVLVRRAAFEQLGMFDESLTDGAALVDFALRARARNFEVVGVPSLTVERVADAAATMPLDDLARLQLLAMHRPELLGRALADTPQLWQLGPHELPGLLQQVLARLPAAADLAAQRAAIEQAAIGLAQYAVPSAQVCELLRSQRIALLRPLAEHDGMLHRDRIAAARRDAEAPAGDDHVAARAALARDVELVSACLVEAATALHAAYDERTAIDVDRHAHLARAERAEGARAAAAAQRDQLEEWLRMAQADLQRLNEHQQEIERQVLEAHRTAAAETAAAAAVRLQLEQQTNDLQHRVQEREREIASMREHLDAMARAARLPEDDGHEQLPARIAALDRVAAELSSTLSGAGVADSSALLTLLQELRRRSDDADRALADRERTIADRERTIAELLAEVRRRRLFPRPLRAHEQALLDRLGQAP